MFLLNEPRHEKVCLFAYAKRKAAQLISAFVFATQIVQSHFFPNPKFQVASHLHWFHRFVSGLVGNLEDRLSRDAGH